LAGGIMYQGRAPSVPRPEARAATTPASTPNVRVVSLTEVAAGPVVLLQPGSGGLAGHWYGLVYAPAATCGGAERGRSTCGGYVGRSKLHRGAGASIEPHARCRKGTRTQQGGSSEH